MSHWLFQRPVLTAFRFLFPKTLTDSSHEQIMVATFVNKYADDVSDDLFNQVLAVRYCAAECIKMAQANNNNVKNTSQLYYSTRFDFQFP